MIAYITAPFRWTKIHKHGYSCFPMSLKPSNSSNAFALVSSSTCVFQGGIKMHDRSTPVCRLLRTTLFRSTGDRSPRERCGIPDWDENHGSDGGIAAGKML